MFRLISAIRDHEVGITSNRESARHGEFVPEPCTPRPSHTESSLGWKYIIFINMYLSLERD